jgi:hypothetical protein
VLGESFSDGWTASSPELGDLGGPTLVQGYANGWALDPAAGTVHLTLTWGPQKVVWAGIGVSVVGVLVCLAVLLVPWIRRRRRGGPRPTRPDAGPLPDDGAAAAARRAPSRGWAAPLCLGGAVALFAGLNLPDPGAVPVLLALALGAATAAVVRWGWGAMLLGLAPAGALAVAGLYSVAKEWRGDYQNFEWPMVTEPVEVLGVVAVLALVAVGVVAAWRDERSPGGVGPAREGPDG